MSPKMMVKAKRQKNIVQYHLYIRFKYMQYNSNIA